jgi:hypothetical protein
MRSLPFVTTLVKLAGLALIMAATPAQPQGPRHDGPRSGDWLDAHNEVRAEAGIAPLVWSDRLARDAQDWADHLAATGRYDHASPMQRQGQGENLWRGPRGYWDTWDKVGFFVEEKRHFRPGQFPDVSVTGRWNDVAHYTQVIWPQTREVGCALAHTPDEEVLVCRYFPAGNIWGHRIDLAEHIARR